MENFDVKKIRKELEEALNRSFDMSREIAVYGAGNASVLAHACFEFIETVSASPRGGNKIFY